MKQTVQVGDTYMLGDVQMVVVEVKRQTDSNGVVSVSYTHLTLPTN